MINLTAAKGVVILLQLYKHQKVELAHLRLNDSFAIFAEQG